MKPKTRGSFKISLPGHVRTFILTLLQILDKSPSYSLVQFDFMIFDLICTGIRYHVNANQSQCVLSSVLSKLTPSLAQLLPFFIKPVGNHFCDRERGSCSRRGCIPDM